ncbi:sodium-dependent nutrient amino acid transporter 1 isoform X1 [Ixodes scapularis]
MNEHFFHLSIGLKHHQLGDMANFHPQLMICLGLTWALLFLCSTMGLKPTGKKSFLVGVVTLGLVIFLMVSTVWQEGAVYGLIYMLLPKWSSLLKITVWTRAVEQVFFTFGITSGPLLVYGSYNHFFANIHKVVLFVTMLSLGASLMYAVIVFGSLGTMSWNMNIPVGDIVHGGHSVIFVAMNKYSIHWTLSTVFFLLVIVTGTNSQVLIVNVAVTHWRDMFPVIRSKRPLLVSYCIVGFAFGLPFVTKAGLYLLHLVDTQVVSFMLIYIAAFELLAVMWIYGLDHLKLDIMLMHGELSAVKLEVAWCIILPVILAATVMTNLLTSCSSLRLGPIEYPVYACYIGWSLIMLGALQVPLWAVVSALKHPSKLEQCLVPCFYNEYNVNSYSASEPAPTQVNPHRFLQKYNSHLVGEN